MDAGEKAQLRLVGRESHEREILLLYDPDSGFAETVIVPDFPAGMVTTAGEAVKDKVTAPPPPPDPLLHAGV